MQLTDLDVYHHVYLRLTPMTTSDLMVGTSRWCFTSTVIALLQIIFLNKADDVHVQLCGTFSGAALYGSVNKCYTVLMVELSAQLAANKTLPQLWQNMQHQVHQHMSLALVAIG